MIHVKTLRRKNAYPHQRLV